MCRRYIAGPPCPPFSDAGKALDEKLYINCISGVTYFEYKDVQSEVFTWVARALDNLSDCVAEHGYVSCFTSLFEDKCNGYAYTLFRNKLLLAYIIENVLPSKNMNLVNFMIEV